MTRGANASQFNLYYYDESTQEEYTALIRLVEGVDTVEYEVQLNEVPIDTETYLGKEVVAKWRFADFSNEATFYTDSNGLEMQERVLDSRPDYTTTSEMHVSNNYYPINSALLIRDTAQKLQVTVMNTRSQGGASIEDGSVELMQNRRLLVDDNLGVDEPLNEMNADGVGLQTIAKYYLQVHNYETGHSLQRSTQLTTDQPIQYFFG